jgi:hypothetical protein
MLAETAANATIPVDMRNPAWLLIDSHVTAIPASDVAHIASNAEFFVDTASNRPPRQIIMHHDIR